MAPPGGPPQQRRSSAEPVRKPDRVSGQRLHEVFGLAMAVEPEGRAQFATLRCADDPELLAEVLALIETER